MKLILLLLLALSYSSADEITRIESIVKDINKLRSEYNNVEEELGVYKYDLRDEKEKNAILNKQITSLNNELKRVNKLLKSKEKENETSKNNLKSTSKNKTILQKCVNNQIIEDDNPFPQLQMKKEFQRNTGESLTSFKASSFRVNKLADIFQSIDGKKVDKWEKSRSFTSNLRSENWVKITGYFINKVWQPSAKELWIRSSDVTIRSE